MVWNYDIIAFPRGLRDVKFIALNFKFPTNFGVDIYESHTAEHHRE